jgi:protein SCO1/2
VAETARLTPARGLLALGLALALSGAWLAWRHGPPPAGPTALPAATVINDRQPLPAFSLHRQGGSLTGADLAGGWTALVFGYTSCTDVCPTSLAKLKELSNRLHQKGLSAPRMVFVSLDAARDTPERLDNFARAFDPGILAATGDAQELAALVGHLGVHYQRVEGLSPENYRIDHTDAIFLVDPQLRLKAVFSWPQDPAAMAAAWPGLTGAPG